MAQNKKKTRRNRPPLIKSIIIGAILMCIILWCAYNFAPRIACYLDAPTIEWKEFITEIFGQEKSNKPISPIDGLEIPNCIEDNQVQVICTYEGFTLSYNSHWKLPNWVAYELTREELNAVVSRKDDFRPDELLDEPQAALSDYRCSGFDRGHMAPAADMRWSATAMSHSFYLTNICPQTPSLNRGDWERLESKIRDWARQEGSIMVVCGPLVGTTDKTIGKNRVCVPSAYYKVILSPYTTLPRGIGFVFANDNENRKMPLLNYSVSIDSVEKLAGIDFFPSLPDDIEENLESSHIPDMWEW